MKKLFVIIVFLLFSQITFSQINNSKKEYKYPCLIKLIEGSSNMFRIGFMRKNDYLDVKEDISSPQASVARFLNDFNMNDKVFIYFPTSKQTGEMMIVNKSCVTKLDMTYEEAIEIILPN